MTKPMRRRDVIAALLAHGSRRLREGSRHEVWGCPCGKHIAPVPNHNQITAGVVRSIQNQMACLPEGWLQ